MRRYAKLLAALLAAAALLGPAGSPALAEEPPQLELPILLLESDIGPEGSERYVSATMRLENAPGLNSLSPSPLEWKLHGQSSLGSEKKSYNLKFPQRVDLLGMGAAKRWVLTANAFDKSLLRNKLMYELSGAIGLCYPLDSRFVELYVNGDYRGLYQLCEAPEIDKERVDIHPAREEFLLEYMLPTRRTADPLVITPIYQLRFVLNSLDYLPPDQSSWLGSFFAAAETAIRHGDRDAVAQYLDLDSMVNGYILYEFSKNADMAIGSTRFILEGGKLHVGAAWDFDLSCGNDSLFPDPLHHVNGTIPAQTDGWYGLQLWYRDLARLPWFQEMLAARYLELQPVLVNLYADNELGRNRVDALAESMPRAIAHNYSLWSVSGNEYSIARDGDESYEENLLYLKTWLQARNEWILSQLEAGKGPQLYA